MGDLGARYECSMPGRIVGACPAADCSGTVTYWPESPVPGVIGDCDRCGATFQLLGGASKMIRPAPLDTGRR